MKGKKCFRKQQPIEPLFAFDYSNRTDEPGALHNQFDAMTDRINNLIVDLCRNSEGKDSISLSEQFSESLLDLRAFMFRNVYNSPEVLAVADMEKVDLIIRSLYGFFLEHPDEIPGIYKQIEKEDGTQEAVKDWICGMTDRYAIRLYDKLFVPHSWR